MILDIGSGYGFGCAVMALKNAVRGVDKSEEHVRFSRGLYPWCDFDVWDIANGPYHIEADIVVSVDVIEHIAEYEKALKNMIDSAREEVWISTPNRLNDQISDEQPKNPYHVREWTPDEFCDLIEGVTDGSVSCHRYYDLGICRETATISPMVYRVMV